MIARYVALVVLLVYVPVGLLGGGMRDPHEVWPWLTAVGAVLLALIVRTEARSDLRQLCTFWVLFGLFTSFGVAIPMVDSGPWSLAGALTLLSAVSWVAAIGYLIALHFRRDAVPDLLGPHFGRHLVEHRGVRIAGVRMPRSVPVGRVFPFETLVQNGWATDHRVRLEIRKLGVLPLGDVPIVQSSELATLAPGQCARLLHTAAATRPGRFSIHVQPIVDGPGGKRLLFRDVRSYTPPVSGSMQVLSLLAGVLRWGGGIRFELEVTPAEVAPAAPPPIEPPQVHPLTDPPA